MTDTPNPDAAETPLADRLDEIAAEHSPGQAQAIHPGHVIMDAQDLPDRDLLERIHTQLGYLVDVLAPHGQIKRDLDIVSSSFVAGGPLWGRLDHADVQAHALAARLDDLAATLGPALAKLDRVDQFIADNQDVLDRAKRMMGTGDALRKAMPGGHRRARP
jgi:hypothetical protein